MNRLFRYLLLVMLIASAVKVQAQQFAYIYIQGDKQIPFYVKLEGVMVERYGKNYCILPQLDPGPADIEILFQQNSVPPQKFTILIPEGGRRGFLLTQRDGKYALYDLQQQFYLPSGNKAEDDHLPVTGNTGAATAVSSLLPTEDDSVTIEDEAPKTIEITQAPPPRQRAKPVKEKKKVFKPAAKQKPVDDGQPKFMGIELNNDRTPAPANPNTTATNSATDKMADTVRKQPLAQNFQNSDCPKPMEDAAFEVVYKAMMQQSTDEDRIGYLNGQMDKCYLSWHARTLGSLLTEDVARFSFLKKVYPRITDQQAFPLLDDMLRSDVWKAQFQQLIHH